jgi:hypothetical protein
MNKNMYAVFRMSVGVDFIITEVHNYNLLFAQNRNGEPLESEPNFTPTEMSVDIDYKLRNSTV